MKSLLWFLACRILASMPAIGQIDVAAGNLTAGVQYQGQPIPGECYFHFDVQGGGVNCGGNSYNVPVGNYTRTEGHGDPLPAVLFTITAGQTTVADVETSGLAGIISGRFQIIAAAGQTRDLCNIGADSACNTERTGATSLAQSAGSAYQVSTHFTVKPDDPANGGTTPGTGTFSLQIP